MGEKNPPVPELPTLYQLKINIFIEYGGKKIKELLQHQLQKGTVKITNKNKHTTTTTVVCLALLM